MKDAYYFSHDCGARNDPKILQLRLKMGWEGYGLFFAFIEVLREQDDCKFPSNATATLELGFSISKEKLETFFNSAISSGLLVDNGEFIYSESLNNRMVLKEAAHKRRVEAGRKGGIAKALVKQCLASKEKEKKVKEIKEKKKKHGEFENVLLTDSEYESLKDKFNGRAKEKIHNISEYMARTGKSYKSHYLTLLAWDRRNGEGREEGSTPKGLNGEII